jgi:hypothetical protein
MLGDSVGRKVTAAKAFFFFRVMFCDDVLGGQVSQCGV